MVLSLAGADVVAPRWVAAIQLARVNLVMCGVDFARTAATMGLSADDVLASLRGLPSSPCHLPKDWTNAFERLILAEFEAARVG